MSSGVEASVMVKPSYGLTDDEIAGMLRESMDHAHDDMDARSLREQQVEARRVIEATEHALDQDGDLLDGSERGAIERVVANLRVLMEGRDHRVVKRGIEELNAATASFAAQRMNRSIRKALAGHRVDEIGV
jgi:molecular chaperone HscA